MGLLSLQDHCKPKQLLRFSEARNVQVLTLVVGNLYVANKWKTKPAVAFLSVPLTSCAYPANRNVWPTCQFAPGSPICRLTMPSLFTDELIITTRELVQRHVDESFANHQSVSFDDSLQRSHRTFRGRHSLPTSFQSSNLGSSCFSSFGTIPGHEVIETTVRFLGVARLDTHCVFRLQVDTGRENFVLLKRFSQFRDLRLQLLLHGKAVVVSDDKKPQSKCRSGACRQLVQQLATFKFPRRKMSFRLHRDDDVRIARDRQSQLQRFVEMVLAVYRSAPKRQVRCCVNSQCQMLAAIRSFLEIKDLGENQLPDWKSASNGSRNSGDLLILDTPPSTGGTTHHSPVSSYSDDAASSNGSPFPARTSAMCLEELYTITEDMERV